MLIITTANAAPSPTYTRKGVAWNEDVVVTRCTNAGSRIGTGAEVAVVGVVVVGVVVVSVVVVGVLVVLLDIITVADPPALRRRFCAQSHWQYPTGPHS